MKSAENGHAKQNKNRTKTILRTKSFKVNPDTQHLPGGAIRPYTAERAKFTQHALIG